MKLKKITIIDNTKENTIFEVIYVNFWGVYKTRKGYRLGKHDLCKWLDTDEIIYHHSDSICTILDLKIKEFFI